MEETTKADVLAKELSTLPLGNLLNINQKRSPLANCVNDMTGEKETTENWKQYYSNLLDSYKGSKLKDKVLCNMKQVELSEGMIVSASQVHDCILKLEKGKTPGLDRLINEALVYAGTRLSVLLALCYSSILLHGVLPSSMIQTVMIPLVKTDVRTFLTQTTIDQWL